MNTVKNAIFVLSLLFLGLTIYNITKDIEPELIDQSIDPLAMLDNPEKIDWDLWEEIFKNTNDFTRTKMSDNFDQWYLAQGERLETGNFEPEEVGRIALEVAERKVWVIELKKQVENE